MRRAAFLGTPEAAVPSLRTVAALFEPTVVITKPDQPAGRGRRRRPSPVAVAAAELGMPVAKPGNHAELVEALEGPLEVGIVVAYGMLLRPVVLAGARLGFLNVHFSLLPRWRGAAPVQGALLAGDAVTGVTVFRIDEGLDTGPVLATRSLPIGGDERATELTERLAEAGARLLADTLPPYLAGSLVPVPQPVSGVTHAGKPSPGAERLDPTATADQFVRRVRAFGVEPGAFGFVDGTNFKVLQARSASSPGMAPGELLVAGGALLCGVGDGAVELVEVQAAGRRPMAGAAWARGRRGRLGRLE